MELISDIVLLYFTFMNDLTVSTIGIIPFMLSHYTLIIFRDDFLNNTLKAYLHIYDTFKKNKVNTFVKSI